MSFELNVLIYLQYEDFPVAYIKMRLKTRKVSNLYLFRFARNQNNYNIN